jgi:adenosylcobinamide-GDP ribazoletransferase
MDGAWQDSKHLRETPLLRSVVINLIVAAGFLTRLAPARIVQPEKLGQSLPYFPLVGLAIGLVLVAPLFLGLAAGYPWVQAWLWLAGALYLTRGLHWDGWVDVWDAWGSGAAGEHFWEVLKDSRMGAFGGMGLFMGLAGQLVLLYSALQHQAWGVLIWAPVLGRTAATILAWLGRDLGRPGLGGVFLTAADIRCLLLAVGQAALLGLLLVSGKTLLLAWALLLVGLLLLAQLAKSRQGLNGDFLGTAIVWGEICVLSAYVLLRCSP